MAQSMCGVLKFSSTRSCFASIPSNWAKNLKHQNLVILKILHGENQVYFVSVNRHISSNSTDDIIKLSGKYAMALGIQDGDQVLVQECEEIVSPVQKVTLEPLNPDDWEIMSLNSQMIESDLLNQVRIVWKGQVFPVWVQGSWCLSKVVELVPDNHPALLVEWTEVHIIPKERQVSPDSNSQISQTSNITKKRRPKHFRWHNRRAVQSAEVNVSEGEQSDSVKTVESAPVHSQTKNDDGLVFSMFRSLVKSVLPQNVEQADKISSPSEEKAVDFVNKLDEIISTPFPVNLRLRVVSCVPFSKKSTLPLGLQATTVFISARTLLSQCPHVPEVPTCFVGKISKVFSPLERQERISQKISSLSSKSSDSKNKVQKERDDSKSAGDKMQARKESMFASVNVRVVVLPFFEEIADVPATIFLPLNYVAVPRELQRHLGLEVSGVVHCESIHNGPLDVENFILHPISITEKYEKEKVAADFLKWATEALVASEDLSMGSSLLISDSTLVSLQHGKGKHDFALTLIETDGLEAAYSKSIKSSSHSIVESGAQSEAVPVLPITPQYGYLTKQMLEKLSVKLGAYSPLVSKSIWCSLNLHKVQDLYPSIAALRIEALGGVKDLCEKAIEDFLYWFKLRPIALTVSDDYSFFNTMLICGPKGVGKSTVTKALCKKLSSYPYFVCIKMLDCKPLRGKRVETITKKWESAFAEAVHRQPSVIFLDDLDELASAPITPEQEAGPDGIYFAKVAQAFRVLLNNILVNRHKVVVIATAKSIHSLHPYLANAKERHTFFSVHDISPPGIMEREEILKSLVMSKVHLSSTSMDTVSWCELSKKTEGYVARDLDCLVDKATHAAWMRVELQQVESNDEQVDLTQDDFQVALEGYTPSALRGLQLHQGGTKTWKDVGGLHHVKKVIQQIFVWPMKYQKLFAQCPLKPQSSILLYGAPGTGKTLLGSVIAKECGLNFISIKGPELLSKYIGASEQAVRDLFQRAMSARPCILFFDEFDAIAPKRGHDSTGVTDRVVNQLLTQMDGVESMQGVYVLAATSRPDLIDPALLRPGRLDKCLNCLLPDEIERKDILNALSSSLSLAEDVDLSAIAKAAEHFSGADLQALLYSSQLEAFHDNQNQKKRQSFDSEGKGSSLSTDFIYMPSLAEGPRTPTPEEEKKIIQEINIIRDNLLGKHSVSLSKRSHRKYSILSIVIQQKHVLKTISQMKPSVSAAERRRYQAIYDKFVNSSGGDFTPTTSETKRVTLA